MIDGKKLRGESGAGISRGVRCLILASLALAVCLLTLPQGAGATSAIWNGSQAGTVYSNVNNWNGPPASAPGGFPGEFASFPGPGVTSYIVNINASPPNPLLRFNFLNTLATPYTINVNGGNLIFNGQGVITPLPGLATFNIASGASLTFLPPSPNMPGLAAYVNDGTMTFAPGAQIAGSIAGSGLFNLTGTALFTGVDNTSTTVSGTIEGIGNLSKAGTGTLTLSGANTYGLGTFLGGGTLAAGSSSGAGFGPFGTGTLNITSGTLQASGTQTVSNPVTVGGNFSLGGGVGDNLTLTGTIQYLGAFNLTNKGAGANTLSGVISGAGGVTENAGAGPLILSGANTYTGPTNLLGGGTLVAAHDGAFGNGVLNILGPGTLAANGAARTLVNPLVVINSPDVILGNSLFNQNLTFSPLTNVSIAVPNPNIMVNNTTEFQGTITAANDFTKTGPGTLILSGNSLGTYTGTVSVDAGTVNLIGPIGALGGSVHLNSGGTFNLNSTNLASLLPTAVTMAGASVFNMGPGSIYLAPGGLTVPVGGTFTSAAPSTMIVGLGALGFINSGTATVNGTITGDFTNGAGAFLNGAGIINGMVTNLGTLNPGNSPGTITIVNGPFNNAPGAALAVEVASPASYDKVNVIGVPGAAIITGSTIAPRLLGGYIPPMNQVFPGVISTTGGVTGAFAQIADPRISPTLFWRALYDPLAVDLKVVGNYSPADLGLSHNQQSVASMLDALAPSTTSGDLFTVFEAINSLTTNQAVRSAYDEISPQKYAFLPTLGFPVTHLQFQYLQNRLARQRWEAELGSNVVSTGGGGFMRGFNFGYENSTKMLLAASNLTLSDAGNPLIRTGPEHRWGIYLEPMANWGSLSTTTGQAGYHYKNFGFTLGADYWVMDNWLVGVNAGYSRDLTGVGGTGGDINANFIPFNAYSAYFVKGFYVNGALGYTFSNYDMERNVAFGTINRIAQANTTGNQFQAGGETGYDFTVGNAILGPTVTLQYATQTTAGFTESNAGALNLKVGSQSADSLQTGVGARASYRATVGSVAVKPQLSVVWQHEFSDNTRGLNASLAQGSPALNFRTEKIGQNFAVVSFDLPARITKNFVAHAGYTAEVGRDKSSNMGVNVGLKYAF